MFINQTVRSIDITAPAKASAISKNSTNDTQAFAKGRTGYVPVNVG